MGNRAVITTTEGIRNSDTNVGIYVHWNGGVVSVKSFLLYCDIHNYRCPDEDSYGWARLTQTIANFFGGDGLSIGIDTVSKLDTDNWDNGTYIIEGWNIIDKEYGADIPETISLEDMYNNLIEINDCQPDRVKLSEDELKGGLDRVLKEQKNEHYCFIV